MPVKLYSIRGWAKTFENSRSRAVEHARWVPIPNKHDGETYSRLMLEERAAEIFSCWVLLLQVASKCTPRGTLVKGDGKPHTVTSLSLKCRAPISWFRVGIDYLERHTDWLEVVEIQGDAEECQSGDGRVIVGCQAGDTHLPKKGREGKEGNEGDFCEACVGEADFFENPPTQDEGATLGGIEAPSQKRFQPPSIEAVKLQCAKVGLPEVEGDKFWNYYESNGWRVGKNKMKSWPHALVNWKNNWQAFQQPKPQPKKVQL